jgi:hypothetical protein
MCKGPRTCRDEGRHCTSLGPVLSSIGASFFCCSSSQFLSSPSGQPHRHGHGSLGRNGCQSACFGKSGRVIE